MSLQPGVEDLSTGDLIARVQNGIYVVGDKSWSIDMQRYNFQFTGQRFYRIRDGRPMASCVMSPPGDEHRFLEFHGGRRRAVDVAARGAFNCGKAQPGQWPR